MKKLITITSLAVVAVVGTTQAAAFTAGNLVVSRVGNGTSALVNTGGEISLLEYSTAGSLAQTINISTTQTSGLQWSGSATSEGAISLSADRTQLTLVGYNTPFTGTGSLASRTDAQAPRAMLSVSADGTFTSPTAVSAFTGNNIRSGVQSASGAYLAGGTTGTIYRTGGTNTTVQSTVTNTRVANIFNGNLYFSTGSGASRGVYGFSGLPTASSTPTLLLNTGASSSPYDFAFNSDGTRAYVAVDNSIMRFDFSGGSWSLTTTSATIGTALTGLAVDFGVSTDTIYTVNPTSLLSVTYSAGNFGTATTLASAGSNYAFRGLEFTAVPEPATYGVAFGGLLLALVVMRRRKAALGA